MFFMGHDCNFSWHTSRELCSSLFKVLGEGDGDKVYFFLVTVQTSHKALLVHSPHGNVTVHSSAAQSLFNDRQPGDPGTASVTTSGSVLDFHPQVSFGVHTPCTSQPAFSPPTTVKVSHHMPWRMVVFFSGWCIIAFYTWLSGASAHLGWLCTDSQRMAPYYCTPSPPGHSVTATTIRLLDNNVHIFFLWKRLSKD